MRTALSAEARLAGAFFRAATLRCLDHWVTLLGELMYPVLKALIMVWLLKGIYQTSWAGASTAMPFGTVVQYVGLAAFAGAFVGFNNAFMVADRVKSGDVIFDLVRPRSWFSSLFAEYTGSRLAAALWPAAAFAAISLGLRLGLPWQAYGRLILLLPFIALLEFALSLNIGIATLWTQNAWGLGLAFTWARQLLSGTLVPLPLLPEHLRAAFYAGPFPWLVDAPVRAVLGSMGMGQAIAGLSAWTLGLLVLATPLYRLVGRRLRINGG